MPSWVAWFTRAARIESNGGGLRSRHPRSRDQRALDARHDDFGEFPRASAAHSEEGELESQSFDNDGERCGGGVGKKVWLARALEYERRNCAAFGVVALDEVFTGLGDVSTDQSGHRVRPFGCALDQVGLLAGKCLGGLYGQLRLSSREVKIYRAPWSRTELEHV